jgi:hypothetical protein
LATPVGEETAVHPFRIDVPEEDLVELRQRILARRWPAFAPGEGEKVGEFTTRFPGSGWRSSENENLR